jgi:hypothetical protein
LANKVKAGNFERNSEKLIVLAKVYRPSKEISTLTFNLERPSCCIEQLNTLLTYYGQQVTNGDKAILKNRSVSLGHLTVSEIALHSGFTYGRRTIHGGIMLENCRQTWISDGARTSAEL